MATDSGTANSRALPLLLRPYLRTDRPPVLIGAAISGVFIIFTLGLAALMDARGARALEVLSVPVQTMATIVTGLLLGILPTSIAVLYRGAERDLDDLAPVLNRDAPDRAALLQEMAEPPKRQLNLLAAIGGTVGLGVVLLDESVSGAYANISALDPRFLWLVLHNVVLIGLGTQLFYIEVRMSRAYARIGARDVTIDLLDTSPLAPFVRKGQRSVVLWSLLSVVFSLYWVMDAAGEINVLVPFFIVVVVTLAFLEPALGVRKSIRAAKSAELCEIDVAIHLERDQLLGKGSRDAPTTTRMSELTAYRKLIEDAREWPFDLPAIARFALVAGLGIGSWLGGALVERLVDAFF